ncbi:MAG: hypothetical protein AAFZ14_07125, partial [Pseudomonadota bacterium]
MTWVPLIPGAALNRWAMATPSAEHFPGVARPMPDRVDYQFRNGWVDTGDLPCREALKDQLPTRQISRPHGPFEQLYLGLDGPDVDFADFCFRPTLIVHALQCRIRATMPGRFVFRLSTCGGVRLWLGEEPVASFEPFTRNRPAEHLFDLSLGKAEMTLTLRLEDLHERDTTCFASLILEEGAGLETSLLPGQSAPDLGPVLAGLRTERVLHDKGRIRLVADPPPHRPLTLEVSGPRPFMRGGLQPPQDRAHRVVTLTPQAPAVDLIEVAAAPPGCLSLTATVVDAGLRVERQLGTTHLTVPVRLTGDLDARRQRAADLIAADPGFEPSIAALLAAGGTRLDLVEEIVAATLTTIEERHDCSDFSILPVLRLWRDSGPELRPSLQARLRTAILGYRYWLDEPGNDVMWFWSENHALCFHTAQLIAGGLFPDEVFPNSGRTGHEQVQHASARLDRWFEAIETNGLCEWNSAAYYPIDMLGLFTLHDMAPDFRDRARAILDR